jgi:hypothetical protein
VRIDKQVVLLVTRKEGNAREDASDFIKSSPSSESLQKVGHNFPTKKEKERGG